ncbi:ArsR/SmtB family transcription factor [Amorphus orientalis]|uniref:DNA-binding transcriptional ArsR family regulator n=1 Tax=Amorphus orientalis TaxID=649198 RepID=A0AAE3VNI5_9HYPH|nr:metalloregulator ArsR/SmtB family transcription factor [Amorphus orientalis]MDQ0315323.1 DNA-binding transcriptional ArsR family regulator [Amorphus orientalis]
MITTASAARSLAALGHETRLDIYRLLVRAGDGGLNVGEIGRHLAMPPSTLAHHLGALVDAGLVIQDRRGREIVNRVDYAVMRRTMSFLSAECCTGVTLVSEDAQ